MEKCFLSKTPGFDQVTVVSDIAKTFKKWFSPLNMTITSVITLWFHLPQWHNISHNKGHHHSDKTSVTKITSSGQNVVSTFDTTSKKLAITSAITHKFGNIAKIT